MQLYTKGCSYVPPTMKIIFLISSIKTEESDLYFCLPVSIHMEMCFFSHKLGTHEVQRCEANNCSTGGRVNISCDFSENSEAKGYLSILCPKRNSSQEMFVVAIREDTSSSDLAISVPGVPPDSYDVVVFDLGRNGLPPSDTNYAAEEEENVTVTNPGEGGGKGYLSEKLFAGFTIPACCLRCV